MFFLAGRGPGAGAGPRGAAQKSLGPRRRRCPPQNGDQEEFLAKEDAQVDNLMYFFKKFRALGQEAGEAAADRDGGAERNGEAVKQEWNGGPESPRQGAGSTPGRARPPPGIVVSDNQRGN